jgi:hypothetical protein
MVHIIWLKREARPFLVFMVGRLLGGIMLFTVIKALKPLRLLRAFIKGTGPTRSHFYLIYQIFRLSISLAAMAAGHGLGKEQCFHSEENQGTCSRIFRVLTDLSKFVKSRRRAWSELCQFGGTTRNVGLQRERVFYLVCYFNWGERSRPYSCPRDDVWDIKEMEIKKPPESDSYPY